MHHGRLQVRLPSAKFLSWGKLTGHHFRFHKIGRDGSAKTNIPHSIKSEDQIYGALFQIAPQEKAILDKIENLHEGYEEYKISLETSHQEVQAFTYIAPDDFRDDTLIPFDWYKAFVVLGARMSGLPKEYICLLEGFPEKPDSDEERAKRKWDIIHHWKELN